MLRASRDDEEGIDDSEDRFDDDSEEYEDDDGEDGKLLKFSNEWKSYASDVTKKVSKDNMKAITLLMLVVVVLARLSTSTATPVESSATSLTRSSSKSLRHSAKSSNYEEDEIDESSSKKSKKKVVEEDEDTKDPTLSDKVPTSNAGGFLTNGGGLSLMQNTNTGNSFMQPGMMQQQGMATQQALMQQQQQQQQAAMWQQQQQQQQQQQALMQAQAQKQMEDQLKAQQEEFKKQQQAILAAQQQQQQMLQQQPLQQQQFGQQAMFMPGQGVPGQGLPGMGFAGHQQQQQGMAGANPLMGQNNMMGQNGLMMVQQPNMLGQQPQQIIPMMGQQPKMMGQQPGTMLSGASQTNPLGMQTNPMMGAHMVQTLGDMTGLGATATPGSSAGNTILGGTTDGTMMPGTIMGNTMMGGTTGTAMTGMAGPTGGLTANAMPGMTSTGRPDDAAMANVAQQVPLTELDHFGESWDPYSTSNVPIFWHIPKSGGSSVKDVIGSCHRMVMATEFGVTDGHDTDTEIAVVYPITPGADAGADRSPFVNVDTTTVAGIERAGQMGFADSGLAGCVVTPFLYEANGLFTSTAKGRLFAVFRNPVDRAVSMFYYIQVATWEPTYSPELQGWTLEQYATSNVIENNWMTRQLSNQLGGDLDDTHLQKAMEVIRRKFLVGIMTKLEESMSRFEKFFQWKYHVNPVNQEACRTRLTSGGSNSNSSNKKEKPKPGEPLWDLLAAQNLYDMQLWEYIETLFEEQAAFVEGIPDNFREIDATCCKCSPATFPPEGFSCPTKVSN